MTLTAKQKVAVAKAPAAQKQQLRNMYHRQQLNNGKPQRTVQTQQPNVVRRRNQRNIPAGANRAAQQPKPKAVARPALQKPAHVPRNCLDPLCPTPVPTALSEGRALPHTGLVRANFSTDPDYRELIVINTNPITGTVGIRLRLGAKGTYMSHAMFTVPTMSQASGAGGPSSCRSMKLGATLVNCSNMMKKGGRVIYLNSTQRLPSRVALADQTTDRKEFTDILNAINASPYSKVTSGDQLSTPQQIIAHPIDQMAYNVFRPFWGTLALHDYFDTVFSPPTDALADQFLRGMSTIAYIIEPTAEVQDYTLTIRAAWYTRWPLASVPGQSMQNIPTAPAGTINSMRDSAELHANELHQVKETGDPWAGTM